MGYKKATHVLPNELLVQVQKYIDGELLYIPRISENRKSWGTETAIRQEMHDRNEHIYAEYLAGETTVSLAAKYFLSVKSIQRIIGQVKKEHSK